MWNSNGNHLLPASACFSIGDYSGFIANLLFSVHCIGIFLSLRAYFIRWNITPALWLKFFVPPLLLNYKLSLVRLINIACQHIPQHFSLLFSTRHYHTSHKFSPAFMNISLHTLSCPVNSNVLGLQPFCLLDTMPVTLKLLSFSGELASDFSIRHNINMPQIQAMIFSRQRRFFCPNPENNKQQNVCNFMRYHQTFRLHWVS